MIHTDGTPTVAHRPGHSVRVDAIPSTLDDVAAWRYECLLKAGATDCEAEILALAPRVDLHEAVTLLERGCPSSTVARILL